MAIKLKDTKASKFTPFGVSAQIRFYNDWAKAMRKHWTGGQLYQLEIAVKKLQETLNKERIARRNALKRKYGIKD